MLSLLQKLIDGILRWQESESYKRLAPKEPISHMGRAAVYVGCILKQPEPLRDARYAAWLR